MTTLIILIYNLILLSGTAYLVAVHDWSGWWFVLTILCLWYTRGKKDE